MFCHNLQHFLLISRYRIILPFETLNMSSSQFRSVENQAQPSLVCEHTLKVYEHSNGQKLSLPFVALTMSHRIIFYDT